MGVDRTQSIPTRTIDVLNKMRSEKDRRNDKQNAEFRIEMRKGLRQKLNGREK